VHIWDVTSTFQLQELSLMREPALDLVAFGSCGLEKGHHYLSVLTQSKINIYEWQ